MKISTSKQNRDVHSTTVAQNEMLEIIAKEVAKKVDIDLNWPGVTWRAHTSSRNTSTGYEYDVFVEITDDHTAKPMVVTDTGDQP